MAKKKYHKIPSAVLEAYQYIGKNWNERSYINAISTIPNGMAISDNWFFSLQKLYNLEITPKLVYLTSYKQGVFSYTPATCKNCGKLLSTEQAINRRSYCSWKCANSSEESIRKIKETLLKHYGVDSPIKSSIIKEQIKKTSLERYGTEHPAKSVKVQQKMQATCLKKYGVKNVFLAKEFRQKVKDILIEKYGVDNCSKSKSIQQKMQATCLKKYGVNHASKSKITREKTRKTLRKRYVNTYTDFLSIKNIECISSKEDFLSLKPLIFRCNNCSTIWIYNPSSAILADVSCPHCKPLVRHTNRSNLENNIFKYISSIYHGKILKNTRKAISPYELDIYLPELNIAFEINGSFWHSENNGIDKNYQFDKSKRCINKGIKLFHIYEYDVLNDINKVKTLIKRAIYNDVEVSIDDCSIKSLSKDEYYKFTKSNSICIYKQSPKYTSYLGVFYNKKLIFAANYSYLSSTLEIYQYCHSYLHNISIFSIISKINKLFTINKVVIHEDLAYPINLSTFLQKCSKKSYISPKYLFVNRAVKIDSSIISNKKLLAKALNKSYDYAKTAYENLENNKFYKIYNAGYVKVTFYGNLSK